MDSSELLARYADGKRDFTWVDLQGASLAGATLAKIGLSRGKLNQAVLTGADLTQAHLLKAEFAGANLQGANLTQATLTKANLTGANLQKANLENANLSRANLTGANLTGANLTGVDLSAANLTGTVLTQADLTGAKLNGANLTGANLEGCNLSEIERHDADFTEAIMPDGTGFDEWAIANPQTEPPAEPEPEDRDTPGDYRAIIPETRDITPDPEPLFPNKGGLQGEKFRDALPWATLIPLGIGYFSFGQQLAVHEASLLAWLLTASGAIAWYYDKVLTWLAPLAGLFAIMFSAPIDLPILLVLPIALAGAATIFSGLFSGRGLYETFKLSIWLWGTMIFAGAFLNGALTIPLIVGFTGVAFGVPSWAGMGYLGFNKNQTLKTIASVAGIGLVLGGFVGWVF